MIHITEFLGSYPVSPAHIGPDNAAQYAKNCDVRHGELKPLAGAMSVFTSLPAGTKGVFAVDEHHLIASSTPMYASLSPTVGDVNDRVYYTNGDGLRVCKWTDASPAGTFPQSWKVGVPAPTTALTVRKVRKNRWPSYPNTQLKAKLFLESSAGRSLEEDVTLSITPGAIPFSSYTATATTDVAQIIAQANADAKAPKVYSGDSLTISGVVLTEAFTEGATAHAVGNWLFTQARRATVSNTGVYLDAIVGGEDLFPGGNIPTSSISNVIMLDGSTASVVFTDASADATAVPADAIPGLEVWLENLDNVGERLWTVYTTNSSAGTIASIPGGGEVTMRPLSGTTYQVSMSFGIIEDRAYVYTMFNDWQEESMPSNPATVSVTYLDDVVLQVDYDACVAQLDGYRPLDHLQFYRSTNGDYVGIKTVPATAADVTGLYNSVLGRDPDTSGLAYWQAQYDAGMSLSDISAAMMNSREYQDATGYLTVEDLYLKLLGRSSDEVGFASWSQAYASGMPLRDIIYGFLVSPEFIPQLHASMPDVTWFYNNVLGRAPDATGLPYWTAYVAANGVRGVADMVYAMMSASEYKAANATRYVTYMLTKVLGRTPTQTEISAALGKYNSGYSLNALTVDAAAVTTDGFKDEGGTLGFTMPSLEWNEPPAGINKLCQLPNGVFAAAIDNYVYLSEPYRPFAWPAIYGQAIPTDVVSIMPFNGQLLVTTTTSPLMISGAHPQAMTQQRIGAGEAAVSEFGLTIASGKPVYASKEGLVVVEGLSGSLAMSNNFFSSEKWRERYASRAQDIVLIGFDSRLIGVFPTGDGFIVNMGVNPMSLVEFSQVAGYPFHIPGQELLYLATPTGAVKMFFGADMPYVWWSKEFTLPSQSDFGACKIVHDGNVTLTFFADGEQFYQRTVTASQWNEVAFRLPATRYLRFSVKIEASCKVQELHIARTMRDLANG